MMKKNPSAAMILPDRAAAVQQESTATTATAVDRHRPHAAARSALQTSVILSPVVRIKRFSRARSVPDRAVSHGQSGGAAVQALYR